MERRIYVTNCPFCLYAMDVRGHFSMCLKCGVERGDEPDHPGKWWTWNDAASRKRRREGWREVPEGALLVAGTEEPE
jgi:hypothetical protein